MKRFCLFLVLSITACVINAQVGSQNYVRTCTMLNEAGNSYVDNILYYDGLGRPFQNVRKTVENGAKKGDALASLQEYDVSGRETNAWLPVVVAADYMATATLKTTATGSSGYSDSRPYSQSVYEASPLNRILQQYGPGTAWYSASRSMRTEYLTNTTTSPLNCINYSVSSTYALTNSGNYTAGQLSVVKMTDEDLNVSYSFADKQGRIVLDRWIQGSESHDTYYVYNELGNLCFVLQPMYQSNANLDLYAFQYKYDGRNRCIWKKSPGAEYIEYTYNTADFLTFSQDGVQRTQAVKKWTYYLYDRLGRLTQQGECAGKDASSGTVVHVQYYYDNYSFVGGTGFPSGQFTQDASGYGRGSLTGSAITVLGSSDKIYTAYYYDIRGREIKRVRNNLLGGYDVTSTVYTFTDHPATVTHTHTASGKTTRTEVYTYSYDHADRLFKVEHMLGGTKVTLASYTYDNLGRLQSKSLHGSAANKQSYTYNIRSWLTGISGSKLTQNLFYNTGNGTAKYNGSISSMTWQAGDESTVRGYKFTYDGLDRMLNATYGETASISTNANRFSENVTGYDKNGNIKNLQRYGQTGASTYGLIDNLTFTLSGNQLTRVDDAVTASAYNGGFEFKDGVKQANEYAYDANGNLTKDLNKGITDISYNCLNLPGVVTFSDGSTITYTYAADGTKLRTVHKIGSTTTTTDYCGNVVYENGTAKQLLTDEGYVTLSDSKYHYYLKDHQGNNRVVINQSGNVEETNHYYPFGGVFASTTSVQPYKYNGKEYDTKKGLNWYDYGARHYDAALGRFHTNDRFAEKYYSMSPYQYGANNPARNIDINGDSIITTLTAEIDGKMTNINYTYKTDVNGEYGFFDPQGNRYSGDNSFMNSLTDALSSLRAGKVGNMLVGELMNSSNIVNIANRKVNSADPNGTYITWNSSRVDGGIDENGNRTRPAFIALGHEMAHIQDVWKGTYDGSLWVGNIPNAEKYATHIENQLRSENGLPLRTHYGVLDTGQGDPQTSLLRKGTGVSLYYKRIVGIGGVYVPTTPYIY